MAGGDPAIDGQSLTGHEGSVVRGQKESGGGDLLGATHPAQVMCLDKAVAELGQRLIAEERGGHRRVD